MRDGSDYTTLEVCLISLCCASKNRYSGKLYVMDKFVTAVINNNNNNNTNDNTTNPT